MSYSRNREIGRFGEDVAARYLQDQGMVVLDRNWSCRFGEIDLVVRDGATLVVCEVKTRTTDRYGGPFEAVTDLKALRLRRLAGAWLSEHSVTPDAVRIDVVSVVLPQRGAPQVDRVSGVA